MLFFPGRKDDRETQCNIAFFWQVVTDCSVDSNSYYLVLFVSHRRSLLPVILAKSLLQPVIQRIDRVCQRSKTPHIKYAAAIRRALNIFMDGISFYLGTPKKPTRIHVLKSSLNTRPVVPKDYVAW